MSMKDVILRLWWTIGAQSHRALAGTVGRNLSGYCSRQASLRKVLSHRVEDACGIDLSAANILMVDCGQVNKVVRALLQTVPTASKMHYSSMGQNSELHLRSTECPA